MCRVKCIYYNCILNNKELKNKEKYINLPLLTSLLFHLLSYHTFNNFNFLFGNCCYVICDKKRETSITSIIFTSFIFLFNNFYVDVWSAVFFYFSVLEIIYFLKAHRRCGNLKKRYFPWCLPTLYFDAPASEMFN